jgi:hypothetical protein
LQILPHPGYKCLPESFGTAKTKIPPVFTHRNLIGLSLVLLLVSIAVGLLKSREIGALHFALVRAVSSQQSATRSRVATEKQLKTRESELKELSSKVTAAEAKARAAEAEQRQSQSGKAELESKLQASEAQVADLRKRVAPVTAAVTPDSKEIVPSNKLKSELAETKRRMEAVEQEKSLLVEKLKAVEDRVDGREEEKARHRSRDKIQGVHGTVLAVNQAYNFVVLSMGEREGVVPNSEMFVMRSGTLIGRIRISSVEPTTSIGDIMTNSLARGVQVQPGDTVIYVGNPSS